MAAINHEIRSAWQALADEASKQRPYPGRRVRVVGGRKHAGRSGVVLRHQVSKFYDVFRYGGDASHHLREMEGRAGYVVLVKQDDGAEFWVRADYTEVDNAGA